jgi:hypothetical protein
MAEPVIGVLTCKELGFACEDGIGHTAVAAVVAEDCALVREQVHDAEFVRESYRMV